MKILALRQWRTHEYIPYTSTAGRRCHAVRTIQNDCHRHWFLQRGEGRLDCEGRERRNLRGRRCVFPTHLHTFADFPVGVATGRRPSLRLLNSTANACVVSFPKISIARTRMKRLPAFSYAWELETSGSPLSLRVR